MGPLVVQEPGRLGQEEPFQRWGWRGALDSADTPRLAPLKAPVVSEPFHKHLPQLSAQAECFWSVERGWVREAAMDFLPGSSVAQRSWRVTGHGAFTPRVRPMLLAQSKHWGVQMAEAPIPLLLGTS